jgi:Recombination endonuclease VII
MSIICDHDHTTGHIRGLLCHNCNVGLGLFKENVTLLKEAAAYLAARKAVEV